VKLLEGRVAFRLPAGAELRPDPLQEDGQFEGQALTDRSTVGVHFAPDSAEAQELPAASGIGANISGRNHDQSALSRDDR
jgi:hypothetical protein